MTTFSRYGNEYAAHISSFLDRIAYIASHTDLPIYTNCRLTANSSEQLVDILIPAIRMKLPASPAPVSASVQSTCDVATASADRNIEFSTNWATEASPKKLLLAAIHRGSLAFPDRILNGDRTVISQICISFRDVVNPVMGHYISECSKSHFRICSARTLRDTARV